jgi:hypothetical protein
LCRDASTRKRKRLRAKVSGGKSPGKAQHYMRESDPFYVFFGWGERAVLEIELSTC